MRRLALPLRGLLTAVLATGLVTGIAACSSSSDPGSSPSSTTRAPEDVLVPDRQVTSGLASLGTATARAAAQISSSESAAKAAAHEADEQWEAIEGRIKKNDTSAYLEFEDALSDVRTGAAAGDAAKVRQGATAIATTTAAYLAKYPG